MEATYRIDKDRAVYHALTDMLYIGYGSTGLDICDTVEDTPSGITVMYQNGEFAGAEIPFFRERFGEDALRISVDAVKPFDMILNSIETM